MSAGWRCKQASERVPVSVKDAVDEALWLLDALQMAFSAIEEKDQRAPLQRLAEVIRSQLLPYSGNGV